ncbi:unnamed protein product [Didymodactylos carnosus]|uniref:UBC core domain-containing protein n=1 Tax=Didymodactylos carnosus TaxID=1234261 RepID=A0A815KYP3_9BILA|nr:unnamed protein product [Didymodactylos carnosus]CAF1399475.1 unnamed protein product [Didymodactylos carnosus]CAF3940484.1 unnamed protein product [Didymodactylos carnosus]CAF4293452.1 unnamed protein product [Didymodactylos carnosus]
MAEPNETKSTVTQPPTPGAASRILRAFEEIQREPPQNMSNFELVDSSNPSVWRAIVHGPENTPYEGGRFKVLIEFPASYPFKPPTLRFDPRLYHPNVHEDGMVSLSSQDATAWSPRSQVGPLLSSVTMLLMEPNPADSPAYAEAAALMLNNKEEFNRVARQWTKDNAQ